MKNKFYKIQVGAFIAAAGVAFFAGSAHAASNSVTAKIHAGALTATDSNCSGVAWTSDSAATASGSSGQVAGNPIDTNNPQRSSYPNTSCLQTYLNDSYFTTDFRVGAQMWVPDSGGEWGPVYWTNWASDIANGQDPNGPYVGFPGITHDRWGQIEIWVQTRPLSDPNEVIHAKLGVDVGEWDFGAPVGTPLAAGASIGTYDGGFGYSAEGGGWGTWALGFQNSGAGTRTPDVFVLSLNATAYNGQYNTTNIPSSFTASQSKSTDASGNPLYISIKNTGSPWVSDRQTVIPSTIVASGGATCSSFGVPAAGSPDGSYCTYQVSNWSDNITLQKLAGGAFTQSPNPLHYDQRTTERTSITTVSCTSSCSLGACSDAASCQTPTQFGGCGGTWTSCASGPQYTTTVISGSRDVPSGATVNFPVSSFTAPSAAGTYAEKWQLSAGASTFGPVMPITFTVGGGSPPGPGSITVSSKNSISTDLVPSSWNFAGSIVDPCNGSTSACSGTSATYASQPAGSATDAYILNASAAPTNYAFHSIERTPIAQSTNSFLAFFNQFIPEVRAESVCGALNVAPSGCPGGTSASLVLVSASDVANFVILWDPIAAMSVTPSPVSLTSGSPSQTVTATNSGAPGSTLSWNAAAPVYSGGASGWLTVSPTSGTVTNGASGNASQSLTFTATPGALANGTYTATVNFSGTSSPGNPPRGTSIGATVTVNFTVTSAGPPAPPVSIITVNPSPNEPVTTPITATCSGGSGSYTWSATGPVIASSYTGSTFTFSYSAPGTYTLTCTDASDSSNSASVPVTITQVTPSCAFAANPNQIVLPGNSVLSWTCANAVSCTINGTSVSPTAGTLNVTPTTNTTYVLQCQGPGVGAGSTSSVQTQVRVVGPGIIEGNP